MSSNTKILLVSSSVLPKRSGSAYITEKLSRQFTAEEMAVFGELAWPRQSAAHRPATGPRFFHFRSGLSLMGRGARFFAAIRRKLSGPLVDRICRVASAERCTHLIGTYPDELYCHSAHLAARRLGLPFSAYFHNTYLDNEAIRHPRAPELQREWFEASNHVFVISQGLATFFQQRYQLTNLFVLPHTFDHFPVDNGSTESWPASPGRLRLVLFGNFNESNMEATRRLVDTFGGDPAIELNLYTHVPAMLLQQRGLNMADVRHRGFIDDRQLIGELRKHDVVVLTHGFRGAYGDVEYRTIFPTRTIPALLSGRPILIHSPANSFLTEFAQTHNVGAVVEEPEPKALRAALAHLRSDPRRAETFCQNAREAARYFHGPRVAQSLRRVLGMS
jgi:hypothetical protein